MQGASGLALVHSVDGGQDDPSPGPLCDDALATDGFRVSCQQHPVQDGHADGSLGLLGSEAAGLQPWSNQRFVGAHCGGVSPNRRKFRRSPTFRISMVGTDFQATLEAASGLELVSRLSVFDPKYRKFQPTRPFPRAI